MTSSEPAASAPTKDDPRRTIRRLGAALTFVGWLFLVGIQAFPLLGEALVAFAIAVVVPLGVALGAPDEDDRFRVVAKRSVAALGPLGLAAFLFPPGAASAALAGAWLLATCFVALAGARRAWKRRTGGGAGPIEEIAIDLGHLYLPVGGAWLFASRAGMSPMGFQEPIVLYTAAHFHFAGFAAPMVVGLVGRELSVTNASSGPASRLFYRIAAVVVMAGVPLVAAGITVSHALEAPSSVLLGSGMLVLAVFLWLAALRRLFGATSTGSGRYEVAIRRLTSVLLFVAGLSLLGSMMLAVAFTLTGSAGRDSGPTLIPLSTMVAYHGVANAFGFATTALVAFALAPPPTKPSAGA